MAYSAEERERLLIAVFTRMKSGQSLMQACAAENVPESTIRLWADKDEDTSAEYARARGALIDSHVNDLLGIADTEPDAARARVQIDTRKWIMSKLMPKRFGERVTNENVGPDGGPMQFQMIERRIVDSSDD
jgi:hypothetical protein